VTNELDESTTVHWHGLDVPNEMDGPAGITQDPIQPGDTYRYEYTVKQWGTFFYHPTITPTGSRPSACTGR
jgi:FtsP/CotA-like multicopper oxidase with cupredoxin domain